MAVFTVDQERMKSYIEMGFDKEEAFKMCKEEAEAMNKDAAKQAKAEANKEPANPEGNNEPTNPAEPEDDTKFIKKEEVGNIVKDTIKGLKDDAEFKNFLTGAAGAGAIPPEEKTPESVVRAAVEKMRTGK
ncbi:MAG: hypothetical protein J6S85_18275 [Methanobrevibacter sp.]|nr:hypothetical protein [Methanobrevibacter sp.]